jgi:uncharacterized membrane protein SpoIIM required for sporulation
MLKTFLETRIDKWKRLEELTSRVSRYRLKNMNSEEVREFGRLYRRTAADLAIAREEVRDRRLVNYLNHLVARAHGAIYRNESSGFGVFLSFFRRELPAVFRKTFAYTLTSFFMFLLPAAFAFVMCFVDEGFAERVEPRLRQKIIAGENWTEEINRVNPLASTAIQTNNITVTFITFAGGLLLGVGTLLALMHNGLMIGMVMGLCVKYKFWAIPIFVAAHGVIELSAIFIAGGAGLLIGKALLMPGDMRRIDALVTNGSSAIKLILGCIPMLLIAGIIEGFISPAHISPYYKYSVAAASAILLTVYFLRGQRQGSEQGSGVGGRGAGL